jgi:1,4-alpha-glucan branching enzyme
MLGQTTRHLPVLEESFSLLTEHDIYLFKEGSHFHLYNKLGAHPVSVKDCEGVYFSVWAPNAVHVSVIGDFNQWAVGQTPMRVREDSSGIWEVFVPGLPKGSLYKYHIESRYNGYGVDKGDPYAMYWEVRPRTASVVWDLDYDWGDEDWMKSRAKVNSLSAPMSIYEVHLGSWRRVPDECNRPLTYREMAEYLGKYCCDMGFTHVELMPVMEHPFYGSWGYQKVGYFAPSSAYGTPQDFMYLVDQLHQKGIGVILDWVPSHFPNDEHGLTFFDGTNLYEHADPQQGFHPEWNTYIFNHGRYEVKEFLISSALFWLDKYHVDGLRVDAVASMLYLDYARKEGEWVPNQYGGRENLEAVQFIQTMNHAIYKEYPDVQIFAEESTAWPMVSKPTYVGGLGFGLKWNMGWMHDTLDYFSKDPIYRKYHHNQMTFSLLYAFTENFILPFSHDEVVYGKGSLLNKMPGYFHDKFSNLRLLWGYLFAHPGKKLVFMGGEFGQWNEWNHDASLDWHLLENPMHQGIQRWVMDLNRYYKACPPLYELDFTYDGFEWVDCKDWEQGVLAFVRKGKSNDKWVLVVCNFTPIPRLNYRMGVPRSGWWKEALNSDATIYGGQGFGNFGGLHTDAIQAHGHGNSLSLSLPPLSVVFLENE